VSKLPRDAKGERFVRALERIGYRVVRQTSSHVRMKGGLGGQHPLTIPLHNPVKVGTLSSILNDVVTQTGMTREELLLTFDF
jgi:predicted RNA binding protein YcfA (HicA-like mRNA interferase family)